MPAVLQYFRDTPRARLAAIQWQGRNIRLVAGSHIADMAHLGKAITLCKYTCERKFDAKKYDYIKATLHPFSDGVIADCDGCRSKMVPANLFRKNGTF
jgi:hypothetical protein